MSHTFTKHKMEKESILRPLFMFWASGYYDKVNAFDLEFESMQSTTFLLGFKAAFLSTKHKRRSHLTAPFCMKSEIRHSVP